MSHLLDELLAQAANGSPITATLSAESVAVVFYASGYLDDREEWLDRGVDPLDEVTDADWDVIEKLVANLYQELMTPVSTIPVGTVAQWAVASPPENWLICNGQSLLRADYADLFAVLGTVYGAADGTHFYLPDYREYSPMGAGTTVPIAGAGGSLLHAISPTEMPQHNHGVNDPGHNHAQQVGSVPAYYGTGGTGRTAYSAVVTSNTNRVVTDGQTTGITTQNAGGSSLLSLLHPVRGVHFIIYAGI